MFQDLHAVARHTPLTLIITPNGERLSVIVMPKPTGEAANNAALAKPLSIVGTPAELDAEFPGAIARYAGAVNELRTALDLPLDALEEAKKKAAKKDAAKAETTKKKEAESQVRSEAAKKAARTRATKAAEQKKAREAKAAERKRVREAALKKRRDANAARKAKKIKLPGATTLARIKPSTAPAAKATAMPPAATFPAPAEKPSQSEATGAVRHLASKPGKAECIADLLALLSPGSALTRRQFIRKASTGRRYEKLWKNWEAFIAEANGTRTDQPNSGAAHTGQSAADVPPPPSPPVAEPAAPEPAAPASPRYEIRDDTTRELICMAHDKPGLGDWIEVPPFVNGRHSRAQVVSVSPFRDGGVYTVQREQVTEGAAA